MVAFLVVVLAGFLVAGLLAEPSARPDRPRPEEVAQPRPARPVVIQGPPAGVPAGWTWKPVGPLMARHGHVAGWTGTELILWGGERPGRAPEGAAYDPDTDRWRRIARSPLDNRSGAASAWTGRELLVWGGINADGLLADGAAYDPAADRWRTLPAAPIAGRVPFATTWTGHELVVVGIRGYGRAHGVTDAAAYDPEADRWRMLPPLPVDLNEGAGVWTGAELVVYGAYLDRDRRPVGTHDRARGAALDVATGQWRILPDAPLSGQAIALAWDGGNVVAWDYELRSASLDPAEPRWTDLPDIPLERRDCLPAGVAAGDVVFAQHCGQAAVFDPVQRSWTSVPSPRGANEPPVFTGHALVHWLGPVGRPHDGTWLRPVA